MLLQWFSNNSSVWESSSLHYFGFCMTNDSATEQTQYGTFHSTTIQGFCILASSQTSVVGILNILPWLYQSKYEHHPTHKTHGCWATGIEWFINCQYVTEVSRKSVPSLQQYGYNYCSWMNKHDIDTKHLHGVTSSNWSHTCTWESVPSVLEVHWLTVRFLKCEQLCCSFFFVVDSNNQTEVISAALGV